MDLQTAKLVEFAIFTEADTGIMGIDPKVLAFTWMVLAGCATVEDVLEQLPIDLHWKWDNYWSIWSGELEEPAPVLPDDLEDKNLEAEHIAEGAGGSPEGDQVELTEKGELALEETEGVGKARTITLTPKGEAAAQAAELEIHAESEAKNLEGSQPPAVKRGSKKGR